MYCKILLEKLEHPDLLGGFIKNNVVETRIVELNYIESIKPSSFHDNAS